ncbi:hypothetical protein LPJ53_001632 [Coemansia erecta]|uniref:Uncharacterized protein n=1 Tax=Coemansia erecta TaxID=147472 RepID=A0A9W7Y4Z1_9FUNG|nr:hypothetical protein LPJ53_001632 [Coemansia erecta]
MPTVLLGDQLPEPAFGRIGSRSLGRAGLFRLTLYITIVCSWSLFLLAKRHVRRLSTHTLRHFTETNDLPWISDQPQPTATDTITYLVSSEKDPPPCEHQSPKAYIGQPATYTTNSFQSESTEESQGILPLSAMGAVESLPAQSDHHLLHDDPKTADEAESPSHSASDNPQQSSKGVSLSSAAVCLSYCSKEAEGAILGSEKAQHLRRSSARSLLRASLRRYDQMAPMWARSSSKCNVVDSAVVDEAQNTASVENVTPASPKRMASADDIGALARAVERRRLDSGEAEYGRPAEQQQQQQQHSMSASMPHLPSRIAFLRDSFVSSGKGPDNVSQSPPGSITAAALGGIPEGTSAAASLLLFPIDFISSSPSPSSQAAGDKGNGMRKTRSSSISEIRQRLTRRLSRSSHQQNRRRSRNNSPVTSPTSMSKSIGVVATERSSAALVEVLKDSAQKADELATELAKLSMDDATCDSENKTEENTRLLSESIDCLLEKRLCPESKSDPADASDQIENTACEPPLTSSTSSSSIASATSSLTLSDSGHTSESTGDEGTDILDYDEYMYLNTCKDSSSSSGTGPANASMTDRDENRVPTNCSSMVRRWWPRRVLPVHNMQYMPKLSKLFAEAAQKNRDSGDYLCPDCSTASMTASSNGSRLPPPVDEVMMGSSAPVPVECRDIECRNYLHIDSGCGSSSVTLRDWFSSSPSSAHSSSGLSFGYLKPLNTKCGDSRLSGYWDILSRCPMRPTSGLALSSLKAMAKASLSSNSANSSRHAYNRRISNVGAPISRRARRLADSSGSDTDEDTENSDDDNDSDGPLLKGFLSSSSSSSSAQVRQRGHISGGGSGSGGGGGARGKQRQKRVLSEPMQYILYNSYLRYYGRPGEN